MSRQKRWEMAHLKVLMWRGGGKGRRRWEPASMWKRRRQEGGVARGRLYGGKVTEDCGYVVWLKPKQRPALAKSLM